MAEDEVLITYENLYDLLRREKFKQELQKLDKDFFKEVIGYLTNKKAILNSQEKKDNIFASTEVEKTRTQLKNIKKILKELYEKRESKILKQAIMSSRCGGNGYNTAAMLPEEKVFFNTILKNLDLYRSEILQNLFKCCLPKVKKPKDLKVGSENEDNIVEVFVTSNMPEFIGPDLNPYGPFKKDVVVKLPKEVAENLIKNKQARKK